MEHHPAAALATESTVMKLQQIPQQHQAQQWLCSLRGAAHPRVAFESETEYSMLR